MATEWFAVSTTATAIAGMTLCATVDTPAAGAPAAASAPAVSVIETRVISQQARYCHGWPTLARRHKGQLVLVWSGGRESHVCPFGRVEFMTSDDEGRTWTWPRVLLDSATDDRDSGVMETAKGSLLVTTFTSAKDDELAAWEKLGSKGWPPAPKQLEDWRAAHNRINPEQRKADVGQWMLRSTDGGLSWSQRYATPVNSPHGPVELSDGRLLYVGKELWTETKRTGVCVSTNDGQSWQWLAEVRARPGDQVKEYHELHAVEAADGTLIVQIRNHNSANSGETLQCESSDGGKSWSEPHAIGVWGLPSHLLRLRDGRLLMTYGYRRAPFGNQARLSIDHGRSWSEPITISGDGPGFDLGYPSTVELQDGSLLTVWYEVIKGSSRAVLRQAHWKLAGSQ